MFCKHCGKELKEGAKYCSYCGERQEEEKPEQAAEPSKRGSFFSSNVFRVILIVVIVVAVIAVVFGVRSYRSHYNTQVEPAAEVPLLSNDNIQKARFIVDEVDKCMNDEVFPIDAVSTIESVYDEIRVTDEDDANTVTQLKSDVLDLINELEKDEIFSLFSSADQQKVQEAREDILDLAGLLDEDYYW